MTAGRWIWHPLEKRLVEPEDYLRPSPARSSLGAPMIVSDRMEPVQSMLDGRMYDSKSALRATYKAAGVVEVGNDPARLKPRARPKPDRKAIRDTLERAEARFNRGERVA